VEYGEVLFTLDISKWFIIQIIIMIDSVKIDTEKIKRSIFSTGRLLERSF
jgi:hypothetical protein